MNVIGIELIVITGLLICALAAPQMAEAKVKKYPAVTKNKASRTC